MFHLFIWISAGSNNNLGTFRSELRDIDHKNYCRFTRRNSWNTEVLLGHLTLILLKKKQILYRLRTTTNIKLLVNILKMGENAIFVEFSLVYENSGNMGFSNPSISSWKPTVIFSWDEQLKKLHSVLVSVPLSITLSGICSGPP